MNYDLPSVKKIAWPVVVLHLLFQVVLIFSFWSLCFPGNLILAAICGAGAYLGYSRLSKIIVLRRLRQAMRFFRAGMYREAVEQSQSMYEFLNRHSWIDRYRYVLLLSETAIPYRTIALCNIAYGYWMLNDNPKSLEYYRKTVESYPSFEAFKEALKTVEAAHHSKII